jgi:hypothetical protein
MDTSLMLAVQSHLMIWQQFSMDLRSGSGMKNKPTAYVCGETVWNYLEKLIITGTVQANYQAQGYPTVTRNSKGAIASGELNGGYGFDSILYRTIPIIFDEKCPANVMWGLNENFLKFYGAKSEDLKDITIPQGIEGGANDRPTDDIGFSGRLERSIRRVWRISNHLPIR